MEMLEFTGNWFIDLGILGFVNLMEEVYGWDLEKIEKLLADDFEKTVFWYFPLGYLFYHSKLSALRKEIANIKKKIKEKEKELAKQKEELSTTPNNKEVEKIQKKIIKVQHKLEELEKELSNKEAIMSNAKREFIKRVSGEKLNLKNLIPDFKLNPPPYNRNFYLFNSKEMKKDIGKSLNYLILLLKGDFNRLSKIKSKGLSYEIYPDSTVNPFLFSQTEFPNVSYNLPHSISKLNRLIQIKLPLYLPLLTFYNAFYFIYGKSIVFYTNNLKISYAINTKLKLLSQKSKEQENLFKITWMAILDQLIEEKAEFSLEHMYLIEYSGISNQKLINVEYIGISKLQAEFLMDDKIRDRLNTNVITKATKQKIIETKWMIEEFIKNKPLLPIIFENINLFLNNTVNFKDTLIFIYSAALDKVIAELNMEKTNLFSDDFFFRNKLVYEKAKDTIRGYFYLRSVAEELFSQESQDERKALAYQLFSRLRKNQKYSFVNEILKALNRKEADGVKTLINHIFRNILSNDRTWQSDAVPILAGLIGGGSYE